MLNLPLNYSNTKKERIDYTTLKKLRREKTTPYRIVQKGGYTKLIDHTSTPLPPNFKRKRERKKYRRENEIKNKREKTPNFARHIVLKTEPSQFIFRKFFFLSTSQGADKPLLRRVQEKLQGLLRKVVGRQNNNKNIELFKIF
jgi:hypothetical protein